MNIPARLESRTSKDGKEYQCVVLQLTERSEKLIFLSSIELELLQLTYGNSQTTSQKLKINSSNS